MADSKKAEKHKEQEQEHQAVHAASIAGAMRDDSGKVYRLRVQQAAAANYSNIARHDTTELLVPFDQLLTKFKELHRAGRKVVEVAAV